MVLIFLDLRTLKRSIIRAQGHKCREQAFSVCCTIHESLILSPLLGKRFSMNQKEKQAMSQAT